MTDLKQKLKWYKNNNWQTQAIKIKKLQEIQAYKNASENEKKNMKKKQKKISWQNDKLKFNNLYNRLIY